MELLTYSHYIFHACRAASRWKWPRYFGPAASPWVFLNPMRMDQLDAIFPEELGKSTERRRDRVLPTLQLASHVCQSVECCWCFRPHDHAVAWSLLAEYPPDLPQGD